MRKLKIGPRAGIGRRVGLFRPGGGGPASPLHRQTVRERVEQRLRRNDFPQEEWRSSDQSWRQAHPPTESQRPRTFESIEDDERTPLSLLLLFISSFHRGVVTPFQEPPAPSEPTHSSSTDRCLISTREQPGRSGKRRSRPACRSAKNPSLSST